MKARSEEIELWFVRHQETRANKSNVVQGQLGGRLTPAGKAKAVKLAGFLARQNVHFEALYHSDLRRARESAQAIKRRISIPFIHMTTLLRERSYGRLQGRPVSRISSRHRFPLSIDGDEGVFGGTGAETLSSLEQRAARFIDHVVNQPHSRVLVVGHQTMNNYIINHLLRQELGKPEYNQAHDEVFKLTIDRMGRVKSWERLRVAR